MSVQGLQGKRVAILAGDDVDARELSETRRVLEQAGASVRLVSPHEGRLRTQDGGESDAADCTLEECHASDFSALVIPGGSGARSLARDPKAVQVVREFMLADKPVGAICEGTSLLLAADALAGRIVAALAEMRAEVEDAGGSWVDQPVRIDERLVTGRGADDLEHFSRAIVEAFRDGMEEARVDQVLEQSFPASDPPPGPSAIGGAGAARGRADIDRSDIRP